MADINQQGTEQVASSISSSGGRARAAVLDVTKAEQTRRLIEETAADLGRLDFMFNNAGIAVRGEARDIAWEHWREVLDINLMVIHGTLVAYLLMVQQGFGHIVNTASGAGLFPVPNSAPYATTCSMFSGSGREDRMKFAPNCPNDKRPNCPSNLPHCFGNPAVSRHRSAINDSAEPWLSVLTHARFGIYRRRSWASKAWRRACLS